MANRLRQMISSVVNAAIGKGGKPIVEQPTLRCLKDRADAAGTAFDAACKPHFADGRWGAYRAIECGQEIPATVDAAMTAYHDATQAFYRARDGEGGFLGSRGL